MKILVAGANGLVGSSFVRHCELQGDQVLGHSRQSLDITDQELVRKTIAQEQPEAVINCAAWTDVDGCESDSERAFSVNAQGPENLAEACARVGATFVTISTDYVFDGAKSGFYTQLDEPNPQSVYGASKLAGERQARAAYSQTIIVRTGFVFGAGGRNFLSTVVERVRHGEKMRVIKDARGTPTFAADLAGRLRELAERKVAEVFHVVNSGPGASYEEFAKRALEFAGLDPLKLEPVSVSSLNRPAPRPSNSCLRCLVSQSLGLTAMPHWEDALGRFVCDDIAKSRPQSGLAPTLT